jgi:hypothetical protein
MDDVDAPLVVDLQFTPRPWQAECYRDLHRARFGVVVVNRRGGKTTLAIRRLIVSALQTPGGRFAYIAPTYRMAKDIAWLMVKDVATKVPGVVVNEQELWVQFPNASRLRLYGADSPDSLRGLGFDGITVDEVAQMPQHVWAEVLRPALADRNGWALFIGTPKGTNLFSQLYHRALTDPEWVARAYPYHVTNTLSDDEIAQMRRELTPSQFRQEMECDFSAANDNSLIAFESVQGGVRRGLLHGDRYGFAPKILGVDVAAMGGDRCCMFPRQGLQAFVPKVHQGLPQKVYADTVAKSIARWQPDAVIVDVGGGYGGELVSRLREWGHIITEVNFAWKPSDEKFRNVRAELYFRIKAWLEEGGAIACGEFNTALQTELCAPSYSHDNAAGKLTLESKDDIRVRLGVSPDIADALACTFYGHVVARGDYGHGMGNIAKTTYDYDVFAENQVEERRRARAAAGWR